MAAPSRWPGRINWQSPVGNSDLNRGLVAWYLAAPGFVGGSTFRSLTGRYHGTVNNVTPGASSGWNGTARPGGLSEFRFDGTDDYIEISNELVNSGYHTISFWVKFSSVTGIPINNGLQNSYGWYFIASGTQLFYVTNTSGSAATLTFATSFTTGVWYHITLVQQGTTATSYVNGKLDTTGTVSIPASTPGVTRLGRYASSASFPFAGSADSWRLVARPYASSEVVALYQEEIGGYGTLLNRVQNPFALLPINVTGIAVSSNGQTVTLTCDQTITSVFNEFTVLVNGVSRTATSSFASNSISLDVGSGATTILASDTVTVSYSTSTFGVTAAGGRMLSFSATAATNNSTQTRPSVTSASVNSAGTAVTVNFSEAVNNSSGFTLNVGGVSKAFTASGANGTTARTLTLTSYTITSTDSVTLDYSGSSIVGTTASAVPMSAFTGTIVTNNSTVGASTSEDIKLTVNSMVTYDMTAAWTQVSEASAGAVVRLTPYGDFLPEYWVAGSTPAATQMGARVPAQGLMLTLGTGKNLYVRMSPGTAGGKAVIEVGTA